MPAIVLYAGALALSAGLTGGVVFALAGRGQARGVARSLALIEGGVDKKEVGRSDLSLFDRLAKPVLTLTQRLAIRLSPSGTAERLSKLLDFAGNPSAWTVERVLGTKGAALLGLALLGLLLGGGFSVVGVLIALVAAAVGFFLPDLLLYNLGLKRQDDLRRGLADALDMLTVCVEAGQGFDSAIQQVSRAVTGPVAGEFSRILQEIQIGKPRGEAFTGLSRRTNVPEVKTFVSALVQADRLGLAIGNVLREQAVQMRLVRRQRAEEQAQKVPVKILFPMLLCIFPALFIVVIGPGAIRMVQVFSGMSH